MVVSLLGSPLDSSLQLGLGVKNVTISTSQILASEFLKHPQNGFTVGNLCTEESRFFFFKRAFLVSKSTYEDLKRLEKHE